MTSAHSDQPSAVCHCYPVTSFSIDVVVWKGSCILNLTLGYDLTKSQKYHSFQEWGKLRMPPKFKTIILSSSLIPTELTLPHLLKHTIQNAIVGMKGEHLRKRLRWFSRGLSKRRDIFLIFFFFWLDHLDLWPRAPRMNRGVYIPYFWSPTHIYPHF